MNQSGRWKRIINSMHFRVLILLLVIGLVPVFFFYR